MRESDRALKDNTGRIRAHAPTPVGQSCRFILTSTQQAQRQGQQRRPARVPVPGCGHPTNLPKMSLSCPVISDISTRNPQLTVPFGPWKRAADVSGFGGRIADICCR